MVPTSFLSRLSQDYATISGGRVAAAISYTESGQGPFADALQWNREREARWQQEAAAQKPEGKLAPITTQPNATQDINWGLVAVNVGFANGNVVYTTDYMQVADLALKDAKSKLDQAFREAGIITKPPVDFSLSQYDGSLKVGAHPQQKEIQALFATDKSLAYHVREAFALKDLAIGMQKDALYADAYTRTYATKGKQAAIALADLFRSLDRANSRFSYMPSGIDVAVNGLSQQDYLLAVAKELG